MKLKKEALGFVLLIAAIIIISILLYFSFISIRKVDTQQGFNQALTNCDRVEYIRDGDRAIWKYTILGKQRDFCNVEVRLVSAKEGVQDIKDVEGLNMICSVAEGLAINPEENLKNCHGLLKEGLQDILIEKMHAYIISNIEQIGEEFSTI